METVTISSRFQVVIPRSVRVAMALRPGDKVNVIPFRDRIEIVRVRDVRKLRGFIKGANTSFVRDGEGA